MALRLSLLLLICSCANTGPNALPKRLKGYGREWQPADKADWERTIQSLLHTVKESRSLVLDGSTALTVSDKD